MNNFKNVPFVVPDVFTVEHILDVEQKFSSVFDNHKCLSQIPESDYKPYSNKEQENQSPALFCCPKFTL